MGFSWNSGSKDLLFLHLVAGIKGAFTRFKLSGGSDGVLGGVLAGDFGDATFAAMTNLETENKKGDKNEVEEEEEEVFGIFTGKIVVFLFFMHHSIPNFYDIWPRQIHCIIFLTL